MNLKISAGCLALAGAALCYWSWIAGQPAPKRVFDLSESRQAPKLAIGARTEVNARFTSGEVIEVIDLSRVFEPTGDELALSTLLNSFDEPEFLPFPRLLAPEMLPSPRLVERRVFPDAAEEASSPPNPLELARRQVATLLDSKLAAILSEMQALKGSNVPGTDEAIADESK